MNQKTLLLLLIFFLSLPQPFVAQQIKLSGIVRETDSKDPLPFVNIRVAGTQAGTSSDRNGRFNLFLNAGKHELVFTYIGYKTVKRTIELGAKPMEIDISMKQGEVQLDEMLITLKDNPALRIIREAIAAKEKRREKLTSYSLTSHSKLVADIKDFKGPIGISVNDVTADSSVMIIMESQTDAYWQKPNKYKEIVRARKQSAFIPAANNLLISGFFISDFSNDIIKIGDKKIVGPISDAGLDKYIYRLEGSVFLDDRKIFKIHLSPLDEADPLLEGTIYIADSTFQMQQIEVALNKAARPPFTDSLVFRQQFALFNEAFWMPVDVAVRGSISVATIVTVNLSFEAFSVLQNYEINKNFDEVFDRTRIKILPEADQRDSAYWATHQTIPNTQQELESYKKSDSIKTNFEEKRNEYGVGDIATGKIFGVDNKSVSVPGLIELYRFNRVEGHSFYLPFSANNIVEGLRNISLEAGYGLSDKKFKYAGSLSYRLPTSTRYSFSLGAFSQMSWISNPSISEQAFTTTLLNVFWKYDSKDYFYTKGWNASISGDVLPVISASVGFRQASYANAVKNSDWSLTRRSWDARDNPPINEGTLRTIGLSLDLDTRDYIDNAGTLSRLGGGVGHHYPSLGVVFSEPDIFQSAFRFQQYFVRLRGSFDLGLFGQTNYRFFGGVSEGTTPTQSVYNLVPTIPYLTSQWKFRTLNFREFAGDRMATLFFEHNFKDQIYRWLSLPLLKNSGWGLVFFGGVGWTDMSERSRAIQTVATQTAKTPFYELGFGIDQIFLLFRLDVAWRMNHFRDGRNFSIGISTPFIGN